MSKFAKRSDKTVKRSHLGFVIFVGLWCNIISQSRNSDQSQTSTTMTSKQQVTVFGLHVKLFEPQHVSFGQIVVSYIKTRLAQSSAMTSPFTQRCQARTAQILVQLFL